MSKNQIIDDFELQKSMAVWSFYMSLQCVCQVEQAQPMADHMSDCFQAVMDAMQKQIDALSQQLEAKTEHSKLLEKMILDKVTGGKRSAPRQATSQQ